MTDRYIEFWDTKTQRWYHLALRFYKGCSPVMTDRGDPGKTTLYFYPRDEYVVIATYFAVKAAISKGLSRIHIDREGRLEP
jgi:hypothetical protein